MAIGLNFTRGLGGIDTKETGFDDLTVGLGFEVGGVAVDGVPKGNLLDTVGKEITILKVKVEDDAAIMGVVNPSPFG